MSLTPEYFKVLLISLVIIGFLTDIVLDWLNYTYLKKPYPTALATILSAEEYARSVQYQMERKRFGWISATFSFLLLMSMLLLDGFGWLDTQLREVTEQPILLALLYFAVLFVASDLLSVPFQWYNTFVIEERWGFNKTTPRIFWLDKLKGYLPAALRY